MPLAASLRQGRIRRAAASKMAVGRLRTHSRLLPTRRRQPLALAFSCALVVAHTAEGQASRPDLFRCDGCDAIHDRPHAGLGWKATIPPPGEAGARMVVSGCVFEADGRRPAPNVIVYAYHTTQPASTRHPGARPVRRGAATVICEGGRAPIRRASTASSRSGREPIPTGRIRLIST